MTITTCKLCLRSRPLLDSHVIPRGVFKRLTKGEAGAQHKVVKNEVGAKNRYTTSHQLVEPMLCEGCEQKLNQGGEDYCLRLIPSWAGDFRMRSKLRGIRPDFSSKEIKLWFEASASSELDVAKIFHFALGMMWKSSVSNLGELRGYRGAFGAKYAEELRRYLLKGERLPELFSMIVVVDDKTVPEPYFSTPIRWRDETSRSAQYVHELVLPGVIFQAIVGGARSQQKMAHELSCMGRIEFHEEPISQSRTVQNFLANRSALLN